MAEHTLLPWAISSHAGVISRGWIKSVCKGFPERIVAQVMGQETIEEREANTAYIVRACNAYPDMVKALEQAKAAMLRTRAASIAGCEEGYGKPEKWADELFSSHGGLTASIKAIDALLDDVGGARE